VSFEKENKMLLPPSQREELLPVLIHGAFQGFVTVTVSLAVVLGLWGCGSSASSPTRGGSASAPPVASSSDWNAVAIADPATVQADLVTIANYQPVSGHRSHLATVHLPQPPSHSFPQPMFDGISPDGMHLLYHLWRNQQTQYYLVGAKGSAASFFYAAAAPDEGVAGNAIWMPDNHHVLVIAPELGVREVDTLTGQTQPVLPASLNQGGILVSILRLQLYHDGYLYFAGDAGLCMGLCRVRLQSIQRHITVVSAFREGETTYWLSPDGETIYYEHTGPVGEHGLYAVNIDGTNGRFLHEEGTPIGFASNQQLLFLRQRQGQFQVVALGATAPQDQVILADAAPQAVSLCPVENVLICQINVALAPDGHALAVAGILADGSTMVWSDDLTTGKGLTLLTKPKLRSGIPAQVIGWDRLPTA
jgi:hypothetical protein